MSNKEVKGKKLSLSSAADLRARLLNQRSYIVAQEKTVVYSKPNSVVLDSPDRPNRFSASGTNTSSIGVQRLKQQAKEFASTLGTGSSKNTTAVAASARPTTTASTAGAAPTKLSALQSLAPRKSLPGLLARASTGVINSNTNSLNGSSGPSLMSAPGSLFLSESFTNGGQNNSKANSLQAFGGKTTGTEKSGVVSISEKSRLVAQQRSTASDKPVIASTTTTSTRERSASGEPERNSEERDNKAFIGSDIVPLSNFDKHNVSEIIVPAATVGSAQSSKCSTHSTGGLAAMLQQRSGKQLTTKRFVLYI
jgi:hypothetical protein